MTRLDVEEVRFVPIGAPPGNSAGDRAARESRVRSSLPAPPRAALPVPGEPTAFGRGLVRRFRNSGSGCFFLLFLGVGAGIFLFGLAGTVGPYAEGLRAGNDPRSFLGIMAFGAVFFLVALRMTQIALTGVAHETRSRKGVGAKHPWASDHPWRPEGMGPDYASAGSGMVLGRLAILSLLGLFNLALGSDSWFVWGIILVFDLFGLLILYDSLAKLFQALRRARPRVRWSTFPAFLGTRLDGVFTTRRRLSATGPVRVTLRCVEDVERGGSDAGPMLEPFVIYTQIGDFPGAGRPGERIDTVPFGFDLPDDLPGTNLLRRKAVYWQVVVEVPLAGPNFEAIFLAPVYARPPGVS
jgi:hypothetical protein